MKLLHDPDLRRELLCFGAATLLLPLAALPISPAAAGAVLLCALCFDGLHLLSLRRRQRRMTRLSAELNAILRGDRTPSLEDYTEGELAVLRSELQKLLTGLRAANDALRQDRQKLADALADVSHQLRTPLTSVRLVVSMLSDPSLTRERRMALLQELNRLVERTDWLLDALLKLSRLEAGAVTLHLQPLSAAELLRRASAPLELSMELRDQRLVLEPGDAVLQADLYWTAEALGNILKNCAEHTPAGGTVTVRAEQTALYTQLTVTDTGPGFLPEELPRLFERFYKGKNSGADSFGIGLALARRIVVEQNGTVKAANRPEGGAAFTLRFPVS